MADDRKFLEDQHLKCICDRYIYGKPEIFNTDQRWLIRLQMRSITVNGVEVLRSLISLKKLWRNLVLRTLT